MGATRSPVPSRLPSGRLHPRGKPALSSHLPAALTDAIEGRRGSFRRSVPVKPLPSRTSDSAWSAATPAASPTPTGRSASARSAFLPSTLLPTALTKDLRSTGRSSKPTTFPFASSHTCSDRTRSARTSKRRSPEGALEGAPRHQSHFHQLPQHVALNQRGGWDVRGR